MDVLRETEFLLSRMNRAEKAQVLQWIARDLGGDYEPWSSVGVLQAADGARFIAPITTTSRSSPA